MAHGDRHVGRVDIHVKLDMTAARTLSSRHSVVRKASNTRACGGPQSPVSTPWVLPTAPERVCLARATPWTLVDLGGMTSSKRPRRLHGQGRLGRLGVETTRPRAYISQNHLIRSYDGRHGLRRPWEVGRRASASARGRRGILIRSERISTATGKGLKTRDRVNLCESGLKWLRTWA